MLPAYKLFFFLVPTFVHGGSPVVRMHPFGDVTHLYAIFSWQLLNSVYKWSVLVIIFKLS